MEDREAMGLLKKKTELAARYGRGKEGEYEGTQQEKGKGHQWLCPSQEGEKVVGKSSIGKNPSRITKGNGELGKSLVEEERQVVVMMEKGKDQSSAVKKDPQEKDEEKGRKIEKGEIFVPLAVGSGSADQGLMKKSGRRHRGAKG